MPSVKEFIRETGNSIKEEEKKKKNRNRPTVEEFMAEGQQSAAPSARSIFQPGAFTPQQDSNAAMNGVIGQLNRNDWNSWNNDAQYRRELGLQMIGLERSMKGYDEKTADFDAWWQHQQQEHYLEQMRQMEGLFQQRQQARDTFGSQANYDQYIADQSELERSWEAEHGRGMTRYQWHEQINATAENAYMEMDALENDISRLQREINRAESGMREDGNRYEDYMDATREADALRAQLEEKQRQLEEARERANQYSRLRQYSDVLKFSDLPEMEGWEEGLEARRAEAEAAAEQAGADSRIANPDDPLDPLLQELSRPGLPGASFYEFPQADWTEEERDIFAWYWQQDQDLAKQIAVQLNREHLANNWSATNKEVSEWGHDNLAVSAPLGLAGRVITSPLGIVDWLWQTAGYMASGYEMPRSNFSPRDYANAISAGAAAGLNDKFGTLPEDWAVIGGKGVGDAYQLTGSILESAAWGRVAKGVEAITGSKKLGAAVVNLAFFGNAASETTQQAILRGVPDDQAFWLGFSAGAAEALFETISIESKIHLSRPGTWRAALVNSLKQAGVEASEEFNTTIANTLFEAWIMGGESEYNQMIRQYRLQGMSKDEAERAAWHDWADGLLYDALGGFLSGFISGGFNQGGQVISGSRTEYSGTDRQALLDAALQMDQKSPAYALAQKIQQNGTMSVTEATRLRELMGDTGTRVTDRQKESDRAQIQQRAETALKEAGVENPGAAAQLIAKEVMGEELTRDERRVLKGVQQAEKVSRELQEQVRQETNFRRYQAKLMRQDVKKQNAARKKGADTRTTTVKGEKGAVKIEELTVENGRTMAKVTGTDGKSRTVAFSSLELDDYQRRALNTFQQVLGRDAVAAYNSLGSENIYSMSAYDIMQQAIAWGNIRNMFGAKTTDAAKSLQAALASPIRGKLSDAQVTQAFEIGRKNAAEEKTERPHSRRGTGHVSLDGGTVDGVELKGIQNKDQVKRSKEYRAVKAIAKALGIDVVLFESEAVNSRGDLEGLQGAYQDGVIYLDWNAGMKNLKQVGSRMLLRTMSHELTHFIQQNAPELYEELKDYVTGYLADKMGADFNDLVAQKMAGRNVGRDGAIDEVVADACETMLRDSQAVKDLVQNHRSLWQSIKDFVLKYIGNITAEDTGAIYMQDAIQELQEIWGRGLKAAVENRTDAETASEEMKAEVLESKSEALTEIDPTEEIATVTLPDGAQLSLRPVAPVQPSSDAWSPTHNTEEAMKAYPNLWNVAAEESEKRNPTQIASTQGTYRNIYKILQKEGFTGKILDASSGLGLGTKVGREEFGFDVDDIEPYPDASYKPKYTDYSKLHKKYDAIISSAVLNVLPQDQRDALVVKMGELLNPGGRMFITTRGKDVESLAKTGKNIHLGNMEWIETVKGSYQKGFTQDELKAYLEDALGPDFTVELSSAKNGGKFNNNTSIVVTKNAETATTGGAQLSTREKQIINEAVDKAIQTKGDFGTKGNRIPIREVSQDLVDYVLAASDGEIDLTGKTIALHGSETWHEYMRHALDKKEPDRDQIPFTKRRFANAINAIFNPDYVECISFTPNNRMQRKSFVYAKRTNIGDYIVVVAVSGTGNGKSDVYPAEIIHVNKSKWNAWIRKGSTIAEMLYSADQNMLNSLDIPRIKKNRVSVAQFARNRAIANTPPISQFDNNVSQDDETVKPEGQTSVRNQTETPEFKKWFKDSKVVDEDGKPLIVYHGTEADFTVFDRTKGRSTMDIQGMFFSPWESEAGGYGSKVGAYYLSIQNPAPEGLAYKALNMFKGQNYAGVRAREYLEARGYDGVQNYDEWIAFYPEQIKSATDNVGTFDAGNPDVRFSVRDSSAKTDRELLAGVTAQTVMSERLQQENEILRESVRDLRKLLGQRDSALDKLRRQLRLTKSPELRLNDAKRMTRSMLQDYDSRADAARIAQEVKELGEFILGTELTGEAYDQELDRRLGSIARQVVENAKAEFSEGTDVYKEIASRIKGKKISVDAGNLGDLGDFGAFRKSLFGKLIVSQRAANTLENRSDYTSADQMYAELQADYGETIFPTALNEGEELQNIARALELAKPTEANPFAQDMQAAEESVRNRVLMDLYSGALEQEAPTAADRAKSRRKALQDQIKQLQRENRLSEKESQRMAEQIYALDTALDKARSQYETLLRENAERRNELEKYRKQLDRYEQKEREVSQALNDLDALVKEGTDADAVNKQRARLSDKERQMTEALQAVTKAQQSPALQQILQRERAIERTRTRERIREGVNRRDLRQRVERLWKDMNRRITSPTEKKHIPVPVMQQAIEVLQALNMDTSREGTKSGEKLRAKLTELKARYEALQKDPDYRHAAMYDTQVAEYLTYMIEQVGDTPINKMSVAQLETVYRTLTALDHVARHALKLKLGEEERSAYEVSQAMTRETRSVPKAKTGLAAAWLNAQLSAERMFRRLGGYHKNSTWEQVYRMLNDGQLRQTQIQMEGSMIFADLLAAKEYGKFVDPSSTVDIGLKDEDGNPVKITHGMMVSLWMHLQNEQNRRHVAFGGLTIPGLKDYYNGKKVKGSERAIRIGGALQELAEINDRLQALEESDSASADEIAELEAQRDEVSLKAIEYVESLQESIEKQLTDYDRQWIAACRELFDGLSKRVLNQTTLEVYGIKRATVENYFPIWVDGDFLNTPFETVAKDLSLENAGFMKERVDSSKPIRLADVSDVAASQIRKVSQYAGLMPAIRNFGKIWGKTQTGYRDSLRKAVHETFGQNGVNYIEHLMADLNGARGQDTGALGEFFNRMRGRMAQASLTMNLRVALGQTASYPTAAAVVGWKALHKALWRGGRNNRMLSRADQELIRKWSPLLYYRMQGYRDTELGDIAGMNSKFDRVWKKARWLTGWIQAMDGATVGRLWYAAEYYVQDHNKDLQKGTDAYYEAVAKVFNDIVERTQPNYSTMQRPDILRNPNALVKQLTMFMTQRLQNFNILYDAAATYSTMKADYKAKRNGVTLEDVRQAARDTRRAAVSQVAAGATIVLFKTLAAALMHKVDPFRDDDKELTPESVSMALLDLFMDSMAGNVLFGTEVWDFAESKIFGTTYYGIELSGVGVVTDLIDAASTLFDHAVKGELSGKDADLLAKRLFTVVGIPYSNAKDIVMGGVHWVQDGMAGELGSFEAGVDRTTAMQAHRLYRAYLDKDGARVNKIRGQVPEDKQKDLDKAVREYIREQYKAGDITVYEAMRQLNSYGNASPTVIADFIKDEYKAGNLQKGDAVKYLVEYAGRSQESAEKTVRELSAERDTGVKYSEINDQYMMGEISGQQATQMLVDYGGKDPETAALMVEFWDFQNKHPGSEMEFSQYQTYTNKYKPIGLSPEQYEDYARRMKDCKGVDADGDGKTDSGSKKVEVVALIDSMDLTPAQKDQMYLANNYAESGLKDCPWNNGRSTTYVDKYGKGNIDLTDRNTGLYDNNGRLMTVKSMSFEEDGIEILIPTIVKQNGKWVELSEEEAIDWYHRTGEYLGKFNSVAEANAYAEQLHRDQERMYGNR